MEASFFSSRSRTRRGLSVAGGGLEGFCWSALFSYSRYIEVDSLPMSVVDKRHNKPSRVSGVSVEAKGKRKKKKILNLNKNKTSLCWGSDRRVVVATVVVVIGTRKEDTNECKKKKL